MKHKLLYLLLALMVLGTSCLKKATVTPVVEPSGVFSGQFRLLHRKVGATVIDTPEKADIILTLNGGTHTYTVTGDTSVHAGSFGSYIISSPLVQFADKTYPTTGTPTKTHLVGTYQYYYDGTVFQMLAGSDTLNLQYDLKRVSN